MKDSKRGLARVAHAGVAAVFGVLQGIGSAAAQTSAAAPVAPIASESAPQSLAPVTVQGTPYGPDAVLLPSTISVLGQRQLTEGQPRVNLSESLGQVPGLIVNNRQDYAQDMQLSLRGFGADSAFGVQGVYMTLDDIPLTMPDGQGQSQSIDLPMIGGMKIIKGPFAALYGNAAGGVIQAYTRDAPDPPSLSLGSWTGNWGTHQTTVIGGGTIGNVSGIAGLTDFHTDGWREHSGATRQQFNGTLSWNATPDDRYSLVLNVFNQDAFDPGGLTRAELEQNPRQVEASRIAFNTRKTVSNDQTGLVWEHRFDADNTLRTTVYGGTRGVTQYLPFTGSFGASAGRVIDLSDYFAGTTVD